MFAVVKTGGKQYKVAKDDVVVVERLAAEAGETVQFNHILMIGGDETVVGEPAVEGAAVQAEVVEQGRGPKVLNLKRRRRKHGSRRLKGHRQYLTTLRITEILRSGGDSTGVKAALGASTAVPASAASGTGEAVAPQAGKATAGADTGTGVEPKEPANLVSEAEGEADDLTRISGVGPELRDKLNEIGVYHFSQIAAWGPGEIAYMDERLDANGRMERDDWIGQAKALAADSKE